MSSSNRNKIPFAFSKKLNRVVGVDEVERGLECGCVCIGCGMELKSRQGETNAHHFAHHEGADEACSYSYWVSIRDLAKQLLRESKHIICHNSPKGEASASGNLYKLELFEEENQREKHGADIVFSSAIGSVGIYFLTDEKRSAARNLYGGDNHVLEVDLRPMQDKIVYTVEILRDMIVLEPELKRFVFHNSAQEPDYKYGRLYRAKSIIDNQAYEALHLPPRLINSFGQSDFSAINVAKLYYLKMYELFKHNEHQKECMELNADRVHRFYQFRDQHYAVISVREKYYIYQTLDNEFAVVGSCFYKEEISKIIKSHYDEISVDEQERSASQREYPLLF